MHSNARFLGLIFTFVFTAALGLKCEVSFRKRVWYPTGLSPNQVNCSVIEPTTSEPPATQLFEGTAMSSKPAMTYHHINNSDTSFCQLSSVKSASFACGAFLIVDTSCPDQTTEYLIKDCVGHSKEDLLSDCHLTTISNLATQGIFMFEAETTFVDHFMDAYINKQTELTACFCTEDICNKNETLVIIENPVPSTGATSLDTENSTDDQGNKDGGTQLKVSVSVFWLLLLVAAWQ